MELVLARRAAERRSSFDGPGCAAPESAELPGWYGKLSMLGDFAQRRLPAEVVQACDVWLAGALTASRSQLGERWLDIYLRAPVLCFACAPGVLGAGWWFGVLMPSCDNVGRYFPLMVAQRRSEPPAEPADLAHLMAWFEHLSHAAVDTLDDTALVDDFERALRGAPAWPCEPKPAARWVQQGSADVTVAPDFLRAIQALGTRELIGRLTGCSMWWRRSGDALAGSMSVVTGLPTGLTFCRLLTEA
jgi:type VI secretion system protein ImpM